MRVLVGLALCAALASAAQFHGKWEFGNTLIDYQRVADLQDPSGTYSGKKTVFGEEIDATIKIDGGNEFDLSISGAIEISCANEAYTLNNGVIVVTNVAKTGDCIHDALVDNSVTLESIKYDATADTISVTVKYLVLTVTVELDHTSARAAAALSARPAAGDNLRMRAKIEEYLQNPTSTSPAGEYDGEKSVLGIKVDAEVLFNQNGSLNFSLTGPLTINCAYEAYSYANGAISLPGLSNSNDCLAKALSDNGCSLSSFTYDEASDALEVKVKYHIITISLQLSHKKAFAGDESSEVTIGELYDRYFALYNLQDPAGTYHGTKKVLGQEVSMTAAFSSPGVVALDFKGSFSASCPSEAYKYKNGIITLSGLGSSSDCLEQALDKADATFESVKYDAASDVITVKFKVSILTVTVELAHTGAGFVRPPVASSDVSLGWVINHRYNGAALQAPSGDYVGTKSVLGIKVTADINVASSSAFSFSLSGPLTISCPSEAYSYSGGVINVPGLSKSGDCLHDALANNNCTLESFTYDDASDTITVKVKYSLLTITLELKHA